MTRDDSQVVNAELQLVSLADCPVYPLLALLLQHRLEQVHEKPVEVFLRSHFGDWFLVVPSMIPDDSGDPDLPELVCKQRQPCRHWFQPMNQALHHGACVGASQLFVDEAAEVVAQHIDHDSLIFKALHISVRDLANALEINLEPRLCYLAVVCVLALNLLRSDYFVQMPVAEVGDRNHRVFLAARLWQRPCWRSWQLIQCPRNKLLVAGIQHSRFHCAFELLSKLAVFVPQSVFLLCGESRFVGNVFYFDFAWHSESVLGLTST